MHLAVCLRKAEVLFNAHFRVFSQVSFGGGVAGGGGSGVGVGHGLEGDHGQNTLHQGTVPAPIKQ